MHTPRASHSLSAAETQPHAVSPHHHEVRRGGCVHSPFQSSSAGWLCRSLGADVAGKRSIATRTLRSDGRLAQNDSCVSRIAKAPCFAQNAQPMSRKTLSAKRVASVARRFARNEFEQKRPDLRFGNGNLPSSAFLRAHLDLLRLACPRGIGW